MEITGESKLQTIPTTVKRLRLGESVEHEYNGETVVWVVKSLNAIEPGVVRIGWTNQYVSRWREDHAVKVVAWP